MVRVKDIFLSVQLVFEGSVKSGFLPLKCATVDCN